MCILSRKNNQVYCNGCKPRWVLTKDTFFYDLRSDKSLIIRVLKDLSEGKGQRAIQRTDGVGLTTQKRWLLRAAEHVLPISDHLEKEMHLTRVQIDEFWAFILKKENMTPQELQDNSLYMGDRWTFMAVLADSSYIKDVHSGERTQEQAQTFVQQIKDNSDGQAPFFESDGWFYEEVLTQVYGTIEQVPYKGRGRKPLPKKVPDSNLKYAQRGRPCGCQRTEKRKSS